MEEVFCCIADFYDFLNIIYDFFFISFFCRGNKFAFFFAKLRVYLFPCVWN